jgi:hypothetical protein
MSTDSRSARSLRPRALLWFVLLFVLLGLVRADSARDRHDEAWTLEPAIGALPLPDTPADAVTVDALAARLRADAAHGFGGVIDTLHEPGFMHPPAHHLLLNAWVRAFGSGRLALRLLGIALGALALIGLYRLARRLVPHPAAGAWVVGLAAVAPWFGTVTIILRPYGLALATGLWATEALLAAHERERPDSGRPNAWHMAFVLLSILGLYALYHYAFVLAWHGALLCALAWRRAAAGRGLALGRAVLLMLVVGVAFLPWLPMLRHHLAATGSAPLYFSGLVPAAEWPARISQLVDGFLVEAVVFLWRQPLVAVLLVLQLVTLPLLLLAFRAGVRAEETPAARTAWLTAPLLPAFIAAADLAHGTHTLFVTKTGFLLFPLLLLLIVRAWLTAPWPALRRWGPAAWWLLLGAVTAGNLLHERSDAAPEALVAADLLQPGAESQVVLVNTQHRGEVFPLVLALRDAGVTGVRVAQVDEPHLAAAVEAVLSAPGAMRAMLVNVGARCQCLMPPTAWSEAALSAVAARAQSLGWAVGWGGPGHAGQLVDRNRALTITSPLRGGARAGDEP